MKLGTKRILWISGIGIIGIVALIMIPVLNLFRAHEHCMKQTGMMLQLYAEDHGGRFPYDTNGFGNAILVLAREDPVAIRLFTAPGDDGDHFQKCLADDSVVPEDACSRAYVQGLSRGDNPEIALVFDRYPTRGGDHFRRPWGPWVREVCLLDGSMEIVNERNWPAFTNRQIELLVAAGIPKARAVQIYHPVSRENLR